MREDRYFRKRTVERTSHRFIRSIAVPMRCASPAAAIVTCLALGWQALVPCCFCAHRDSRSTSRAGQCVSECHCCHVATPEKQGGRDHDSRPGPDTPDKPQCPFCYAHSPQFVAETLSVRVSQCDHWGVFEACESAVAPRNARSSCTPVLQWQLRSRSTLVHAQIQLVV